MKSWVLGLFAACLLLAPFAMADGPAFDTQNVISSTKACNVWVNTTFGNSTTDLMQTTKVINHTKSSDTDWSDSANTSTVPIGFDGTGSWSTKRSTTYKYIIYADNGTVSNQSATGYCTSAAYDNINETAGVGGSVNLVAKGGVQFVGHTIDVGLGNRVDAVGLLAAALIIAVVAMAVRQVAKGKNMVTKNF